MSNKVSLESWHLWLFVNGLIIMLYWMFVDVCLLKSCTLKVKLTKLAGLHQLTHLSLSILYDLPTFVKKNMSRMEYLKYMVVQKMYLCLKFGCLKFGFILSVTSLCWKSWTFSWNGVLGSMHLTCHRCRICLTAMTRSHYMRHHLKADGQLLTVMLTLNEQGTTEQYLAEQSWCDAEWERKLT